MAGKVFRHVFREGVAGFIQCREVLHFCESHNTLCASAVRNNGNFHAGVNFGRGRGLRNLWPYHMLVPRARHNIMLRAHVYCARRKEGRGKHISGVFEQVFVCAA